MNQQVYGKIPGLPDSIEPAVRVARINVFECRWLKRRIQDIVLSGPFSMRAFENEETGAVSIKWFNKRDAIARFAAQDNGVAICWLPDDRYWHNRIYIMDQPNNFPVVNYHTATGTYPAQYVQLEIDCLRRALKTIVPIYKVMKNGIEVEFHYTEKECKKYIDRQKKVVTSFTTSGLQQETTCDDEYTIETGEKEQYKPEIVALMKKNRRMEYGWTECSEFMEGIKPKILEEIEKIHKATEGIQPTMTKQGFMNMLRSLTPEEREEALGVARENPGEVTPEVTETATPEQELIPPVITPAEARALPTKQKRKYTKKKEAVPA